MSVQGEFNHIKDSVTEWVLTWHEIRLYSDMREFSKTLQWVMSYTEHRSYSQVGEEGVGEEGEG